MAVFNPLTPERLAALRLVASTEVRLGTAQRAGSHFQHSVALGFLERAKLIERVDGYSPKGAPQPYAEITDGGRSVLERLECDRV